MKARVDQHGQLRCTAGRCRGKLKPWKVDRFKFLYCQNCGKQYHLQGVDNCALVITLILEFSKRNIDDPSKTIWD